MNLQLKNAALLLLTVVPLFSCDDSADGPEPIIVKEGVFVDSPVEGIDYTSGDISGTTNSEGKFEYEEGIAITFTIGDLVLGTTAGKEIISPLDLVETDEASFSNQMVRNIASFLQSLDEDGNAENGIKIGESASALLSRDQISFISPNFRPELIRLLESINESSGSSLAYVSGNDAALHLAQSLNRESEFKILPRSLEGRIWESGEYYTYNTVPTEEYVFRIGDDLNGVRYHFGDNFGFYMNMVYEERGLVGYGTLYSDLDNETPVDSAGNYEYRHRVTSTGFVFDYDVSTYLGYFNYAKIEGDRGELEGTYEYFLRYDQKQIGQEQQILQISKSQLEVFAPTLEGDFPVEISEFDRNDILEEVVQDTIYKSDVDAENYMLIRFNETDNLFVQYDPDVQRIYPGLFTIKK